MIFGLTTETRNDPEYVRNIAFWVRRLFDLTTVRIEELSTSQEVRITRTLYVVDTSAGTVTITLPPAKEAKGEWIKIKKIGASHKVTVDGNGSETIDGALTHDINSNKECHEFVSDGVKWYVAQS
jgi:hypothetical protein